MPHIGLVTKPKDSDSKDRSTLVVKDYFTEEETPERNDNEDANGDDDDDANKSKLQKLIDRFERVTFYAD